MSEPRAPRFHTEERDGSFVISFIDPLLDAENRWIIDKQVSEFISKVSNKTVVLDFRNVKFLSSAAIGGLLELQRKAKKSKVEIRLEQLAPELEEVFHASGLGDVFGLNPTDQ